MNLRSHVSENRLFKSQIEVLSSLASFVCLLHLHEKYVMSLNILSPEDCKKYGKAEEEVSDSDLILGEQNLCQNIQTVLLIP